MWRYTLGNYCISANHTIATNYEFAFGTDDRGTLSDPCPLPNPDLAALGNALKADGQIDVVVGVPVVLNENRRGHDHISLDRDEVPSGNV
jgi:hypothetical protein